MRLRAPVPDDAPGVLTVLVARDIAHLGAPDYTLEDLRDEWCASEFDLSADAVVVELSDRQIVGYAAIRAPGTLAVVAPQFEGRGIGARVLRWAERRERELGREPELILPGGTGATPCWGGGIRLARTVRLPRGEALRRHVRQMFWSRHARNWDALHSTPEAVERYLGLAAWLTAAVAPGARALDLGCGTGGHALALAAHGLDVVAVDFAPGMLARADEKAAHQGLVLELRQHDITRRLPFSDASFGAVVCSYVLQVIADPVAVLSEIRRVLQTGGVALIETPMRRSRSSEVVTDRGSRVFWLAKTLASHVPGAVRLYDLGQLRAELGRAGLIACDERLLARSCAALARPADPGRSLS